MPLKSGYLLYSKHTLSLSHCEREGEGGGKVIEDIGHKTVAARDVAYAQAPTVSGGREHDTSAALKTGGQFGTEEKVGGS